MDTQVSPNLVYRPARAVLSREVMDFLRQYSCGFYPRSSLSIIAAFRSLMRTIGLTEGCPASNFPSYEMVHLTFTDGEMKKFTITERFDFDELELSVNDSSPEERSMIARYIKNDEARIELMLGKTIVTHLKDEMRTNPEFWGGAMACTGVPAVDFIAYLCEFFTRAGGKTLVYDYRLTKTPESTKLRIELLIPKVSAYYLRIQCGFK